MTFSEEVEREARMALSLSRSPRSLSEAERAVVKEQVAQLIEERDGLREVRLENGDQPTPWLDPAPASVLLKVRHGE